MSAEKTPGGRIPGAEKNHSGGGNSSTSDSTPVRRSLTPRQDFREWLIARENDDSIVDDLAYDVRHDDEFPTSDQYRVYVDYLHNHGAINGAYKALAVAWRTYRRGQR